MQKKIAAFKRCYSKPNERERQRETHRDRDRQTDRQTDRQRQTHTESERWRESVRETHRDRQTEAERKTEGGRERERVAELCWCMRGRRLNFRDDLIDVSFPSPARLSNKSARRDQNKNLESRIFIA